MKLYLLLALMIFSFSACTNHGKKVTIEGSKGEVYYKGDGVTKEDAEKLGVYLKNKVPYFDNERRKSIQLAKAKDAGYDIRFVVDKKKLEESPEAIESFGQIGAALSVDLYNNEPVNILLTDTKFKEFRSIPFDREVVKKLMEKLPSTMTEQNDAAEDTSGNGN